MERRGFHVYTARRTNGLNWRTLALRDFDLTGQGHADIGLKRSWDWIGRLWSLEVECAGFMQAPLAEKQWD
jgi:hypothetical protein